MPSLGMTTVIREANYKNARLHSLQGQAERLRPTSGWCLLSFKAIAAGAAFRITATRVAHVNFTERAVIPCAVILTFRNATTNTRVHFLYIFVHHN